MFGELSKSERPRKKRPHMEFDFITGQAGARSVRRPATASSAPVPEKVRPVPPVNPVPVSVEPVQPQQESKPPMSFNEPTPVRAARNIERQIHEQKTVNSVVNGVAISLICGILLVSGLAATGGYVLWKQMQDQSASLSLLEQNTKVRMADMQHDLSEQQVQLSKNLEQTNLRLLTLTTQFESYRSETQQSLAEIKANSRNLERAVSQYQKQSSEQSSMLAQLRDRANR